MASVSSRPSSKKSIKSTILARSTLVDGYGKYVIIVL